MEPVYRKTAKSDWKLATSNLRLLLRLLRPESNAGQFHVVRFFDKSFIWNSKTNNIIATIRQGRKGNLVRYRPNSHYAGVLHNWAVRNGYVAIASTNVGRRHRRIMRMIIPTYSGRQTLLSVLRRTIRVTGFVDRLTGDVIGRLEQAVNTDNDMRAREGSTISFAYNPSSVFASTYTASSAALTSEAVDQAIQSMTTNRISLDASYVGVDIGPPDESMFYEEDIDV